MANSSSTIGTTLSFIWSRVSVHPMNASPKLILILALFWSRPTPPKFLLNAPLRSPATRSLCLQCRAGYTFPLSTVFFNWVKQTNKNATKNMAFSHCYNLEQLVYCKQFSRTFSWLIYKTMLIQPTANSCKWLSTLYQVGRWRFFSCYDGSEGFWIIHKSLMNLIKLSRCLRTCPS